MKAKPKISLKIAVSFSMIFTIVFAIYNFSFAKWVYDDRRGWVWVEDENETKPQPDANKSSNGTTVPDRSPNTAKDDSSDSSSKIDNGQDVMTIEKIHSDIKAMTSVAQISVYCSKHKLEPFKVIMMYSQLVEGKNQTLKKIDDPNLVKPIEGGVVMNQDLKMVLGNESPYTSEEMQVEFQKRFANKPFDIRGSLLTINASFNDPEAFMLEIYINDIHSSVYIDISKASERKIQNLFEGQVIRIQGIFTEREQEQGMSWIYAKEGVILN